MARAVPSDRWCEGLRPVYIRQASHLGKVALAYLELVFRIRESKSTIEPLDNGGTTVAPPELDVVGNLITDGNPPVDSADRCVVDFKFQPEAFS